MRICFVNAFRRFSRIPPIPECVFAKRCRLQQASAFGVEIHHDTFFLSGIRDKFKTILFIHPVDLESPAFIRLFHCQTASASIGELHVHKVFQICRPDIVLCSPLFHCRLLPSSSPEAPSWIPAPPRPPSSRRH